MTMMAHARETSVRGNRRTSIYLYSDTEQKIVELRRRTATGDMSRIIRAAVDFYHETPTSFREAVNELASLRGVETSDIMREMTREAENSLMHEKSRLARGLPVGDQ